MELDNDTADDRSHLAMSSLSPRPYILQTANAALSSKVKSASSNLQVVAGVSGM